jgi:hypothetical protein
MKYISKNKTLLVLLILAAPLPLWYITVVIKRSYAKYYYNKIKNNAKVYCYDTTRNTLNDAYYIENLGYKKEYISFYEQELKGNDIGISFPIKMLSPKEPFFIVDFVSDPTLVKIADFDTTCWGYFECYVYKSILSAKPPSKEMIEAYDIFTEKYKATNEYKMNARSYKSENRISDYGIQCPCE